MCQVVGGVILGLALLSQVLTSSHGDLVSLGSVLPSLTHEMRTWSCQSPPCPPPTPKPPSSRSQVAERATGLLILYLVGAITMVIAILGAYGAHKENKGCLVAVSDARLLQQWPSTYILSIHTSTCKYKPAHFLYSPTPQTHLIILSFWCALSLEAF